jgi:inhibitor of KinA sporulation pathway (predicted exonuclease)
MVESADWGELLGNLPEDGSDFDESQVDVDNGYFTDDANEFGLDDATHTQARHMRGEWSTQEGGLSSDIPSEIAIENDPPNEEIPEPVAENDIDQLSAPELFKQEKLVYISFDIETGGEYCGIVQISAQIFRVASHNSTFESNIESEVFDEYVKPPDDAIWDPRCSDVHGLTPDDEKISKADSIVQVWERFNSYVARHVGRDQRAVLVAWNGQSCDLKWIYKLCQAPRSSLQFHHSITYFTDPMSTIKHYKSCQLNREKTNPRIESYELGCVWSYLTKKNLNGAHNSLVDVKAQTDIVVSDEFMPFLDRKHTYRPITNIWSATEQSEMKKKLESVREVHEPWKELDPEYNSRQHPRRNMYDGPNGGGVRGPSSYITNIMYRPGATLATLFLALIPIFIFEKIVKHTNFYAYEEKVKLVDAYDRDGKLMKKRQFVSCDERDPERRTRTTKKMFEATIGYVIAWFGIIIYHGAQCPGRKMKYWRKAPHGIPIPLIQNTMSFHAFEFLRRYIHFADNRDAKPRSNPLFDPLWKIKKVKSDDE